MKLNHITLVVSDIDKSKKFYKDALGLECTFEKEIGGEQFSKVIGMHDVLLKFAVLKLPEGDFILELAMFIRPKTRLNPDFRHIAFEVENVDALYDHLKTKKVNLVSEPVTISGTDPKIDGKRFFYMKDIDGNLIEILNKRKSSYLD